MWPEDARLIPFPDGRPEPDLAALADELAAAGARAADERSQPSRAFEADLRATLLASYPAGATATAAAGATATAAAGAAPGRSTSQPGLDAPVQVVRPSVSRRDSAPAARPLAPRAVKGWSVLAVAAAIIVAVVALDARSFLIGPMPAHALDVVGATLTRDGRSAPLTAGAELRAGDVVETAGGSARATLAIGGGETRLAAQAAVRLVELRSDVVLEQLAGRAWHRVGGEVGRYTVRTADVAWAATGTAFDLDRRAATSEGELVRAVGVEHTVRADGPDVAVDIVEGSAAIIRLDAATGIRLSDVGPITGADRTDPWLVGNARRDVALGYDPGAFVDLLGEALPSSTPTTATTAPRPTAAPTATARSASEATPTPDLGPTTAPSPERTATPTARPTPKPTAKPTSTPAPTAKPTPKPTAKPTPTAAPTLAALSLDVTGCNGGLAVLAWSKAPADGFEHYQTLRSSSSSIEAVYPPEAPAVAPDALYATDRLALGAVDHGLDPGTVHYRTVAFGPGDTPIAASGVASATVKGVKGLGALGWTETAGVVDLDWAPYGGPGACFSIYKLVASADDATPSYLDGAAALWASETQGDAATSTSALTSGTWYVRLQAFRLTDAGKVLIAHTDVATVTIP